jgi:hypothetical protein
MPVTDDQVAALRTPTESTSFVDVSARFGELPGSGARRQSLQRRDGWRLAAEFP